MIDDRYLLILEKLKEGTKEGKVVWEQTSSDTEYQTKLGSSTITIDNWRLQGGLFRIEVNFFNSEGNKIKELICLQDESNYDYIYDIYYIIKNKYLKEDETLDDIMRHLS